MEVVKVLKLYTDQQNSRLRKRGSNKCKTLNKADRMQKKNIFNTEAEFVPRIPGFSITDTSVLVPEMNYLLCYITAKSYSQSIPNIQFAFNS